MNTLRVILAELWGLFVDDGWFALSIVGWVVLAAVLRSHLPPALLFLGLAVLVVVFARRRAVVSFRAKHPKENSDS